MSTEEPTVPADKLAKIYIRIRDKMQEEKRTWEEQEAKYKEQMEAIEAELLEICKATGSDSLRTKYGTVIRSINTRYWTSDWSNFHKFLLENEAPQLLENRIAQGNMKEFLENHPDKLPPGLNADSKYKVTVRRAKA